MTRTAVALLLALLAALAGCRGRTPDPTPSQEPLAAAPAAAARPDEASAGEGSDRDEPVRPASTRLGLDSRPAPRNVVLLIGDGMGPVHESLGSRWVHGDDGRLRMQRAPHRSMMATHAANAAVTDSASSATSMSTGVKVDYEAVAVALPGDGSPLETVVEQFLAAGRSAGLVTTSRLTHATPAAYAAHVPVRWDEPTIAAQMLALRPTVLFGGGGNGVTAQTAMRAGYSVATDVAGLEALGAEPPPWALVIGREHVPYVGERTPEIPSLPSMTLRALELLDTRPGGFFLMVEGARIDHAAHNNDIARMLPELAEFDEALGVVLRWSEDRDDTLVVLTSDHECGGLSGLGEAAAGVLPEVAWSTTGHTGVPVSVYGWGPYGDAVRGVEDNTDIYWLSRWPLDGR